MSKYVGLSKFIQKQKELHKDLRLKIIGKGEHVRILVEKIEKIDDDGISFKENGGISYIPFDKITIATFFDEHNDTSKSDFNYET